jgi:hypothetical protein
MEQIMSIRNTSKTVTIGEESQVRNYQLEFQNSTLVVSAITLSESGDPVITPVLVQPWKCNPDGTREDFAGDEDAFDWFESVKDTLI